MSIATKRGDLFSVPLDATTWGVGVVVEKWEKELYLVLFKERFENLAALNEVQLGNLTPLFASSSLDAIQECASNSYSGEVVKIMSEVIHKKWAAIYANDEFICVETCSGLRSTASDPAGRLLFLAAVPEPHELGQALQDALSVSRTLTPEEIGQFFDVAAVERRYEDWVSVMMQKFGYMTRRDLFKKMKNCHVECSGGTISIRPTFHEKLEAWSGKGIEKADHVLIAETASTHDLGEGALLALNRCISR